MTSVRSHVRTPRRTLWELALADPDAGSNADGAAPQPWRCSESGIWVVESYALAQQVLATPDTYSNKVSLTQLDPKFPATEIEAIYRAGGVLWSRTLQTNDPPSHRKFRKLVERVFSPAKVAEMAPQIAQAVDTLLARWPVAVPFDAMDAFAVPLPLQVISEQLGVAATDYRLFKRWSDAAIRAIGLGASHEEHVQAARCGVEFQQYFEPKLTDATLRPAGSLIDRVARAAGETEFALTPAEQLSLLHTLMIAGHETTTSTLGSLLLLVVKWPDLGHAALHDERALKGLIEEALRLHAPVQGLFRVTTHATTLGAQALPARAIVCVRLGAANRDARRFAAGDQLALETANSQHLTFGYGIHHCIGAGLARRELAIALAAVLQRFEALTIDPAAPPLEYSRSVMTRSLTSLPLIARRRVTA